jgi:putative hydrolase of the HAD superfamily
MNIFQTSKHRRYKPSFKEVGTVIQEPEARVHGILIDFGGVVAEEGFREGLKAIGRANGQQEETFFSKGADLMYASGYVTGQIEESAYWASLREQTGIIGTDEVLRNEILSRFTLRPWVLDLVRGLRSRGLIVAMLSDQTNWLDELDQRDHFFKDFDRVLNSYHLGKGKKDPSIFDDAARELCLPPEHILFIDDNEDNVNRARSRGLAGAVFQGREPLIECLKTLDLCP